MTQDAQVPEFKPEEAVAFLAEHGTDPKALEGVAPEELKSRYESARTIAEKAREKASPKAPEKYEAFKLPEGATLDEGLAKEFEGVAREAGLDQGKAQKVIDLGGKLAAKLQADITAKVEAAQKSWADASKADAEFGGAKFDENLGVAKKAIATFATPELSKLLNESGLGNHPEVIRLFWKVGQAISEDKLVAGSKAPASNAGMFVYDKSQHVAA